MEQSHATKMFRPIRKNYDGPDYSFYLKKDVWTLREALCLVHDLRPDEWRSWHPPSPSYGSGLSMDAAEEIALSANRAGNLEFLPSSTATEKYVGLRVFVRWAKKKGWDIPEDLLLLLDGLDPSMDEPHVCPHIKEEPLKKLSDRDIAKQACRAIADRKWKAGSTLCITAMAKDCDLRVEGSRRPGHKRYPDKSVQSWIRDLCPNPRRGNPEFRKKKAQRCNSEADAICRPSAQLLASQEKSRKDLATPNRSKSLAHMPSKP